jgi:hypothetical protein
MKLARHNRVLAVVLGAALMLGLGATGSAVADRMIGSKAIKNNSIRSVDVHNGTLALRDLRPGLADRIRQPGPAGPAGTPGQALVANVETPANPNYNGVHVVTVGSVATSSPAPDTNTGANLFASPVNLPAGQYLVHATVQFFDFTGAAEADDYGVARLFLDGAEVPSSAIWSPAVPDDGNNGAQASGTIVVTVPAGGGALSAMAVIRGGDDGEAGASMIVTRIG